jgi:hypothetical protein
MKEFEAAWNLVSHFLKTCLAKVLKNRYQHRAIVKQRKKLRT